MPITPWHQGDRMPIWRLSLVPDTGTFDVSGLTPANFALLIKNSSATPTTTTAGTGVFSNVAAAVLSGSTITSHASVQYLPSAADVATLGDYEVFVVVTFPGSLVQTLSIGDWEVIAK